MFKVKTKRGFVWMDEPIYYRFTEKLWSDYEDLNGQIRPAQIGFDVKFNMWKFSFPMDFSWTRNEVGTVVVLMS